MSRKNLLAEFSAEVPRLADIAPDRNYSRRRLNTEFDTERLAMDRRVFRRQYAKRHAFLMRRLDMDASRFADIPEVVPDGGFEDIGMLEDLYPEEGTHVVGGDVMEFGEVGVPIIPEAPPDLIMNQGFGPQMHVRAIKRKRPEIVNVGGVGGYSLSRKHILKSAYHKQDIPEKVTILV